MKQLNEKLEEFKASLERGIKGGDGDCALIAQYLLDFINGAPEGEEVEVMQGTLENIIDISKSILEELKTLQ